MKILVIPHEPQTALKTRSEEIGKALARMGHQVDVFKRRSQPKDISIIQKIFWHIKQTICLPNTEIKGENLNYLFLPTLHVKKPAWIIFIIDTISTFLLGLRQYDLIYTAGFYGPKPTKKNNILYFYDLVDDHSFYSRENGLIEETKRIDDYIKSEMVNSTRVLTCSMVMQTHIKEYYNFDTTLIPNGADTTFIKNNLENVEKKKYSVGYMGGIDDWVDIQMVVDSLKILRDKGHDFEFYIYGRGHNLDKDSLPEYCHYMGFVTPDTIPKIFKNFNVGLVPFKVSKFTDPVLPLKLIEYGSAKCPSVSTNLKELKLQKLPWVTLSKPNAEDFADAIFEAANQEWNPEWDEYVERYSWDKGAKTLLNLK
jgi:glycosyltransferase involved in cell wall biosynthesis